MAIIVIIAIVLTFSCMLLTSCDKDANNQDDKVDRFYDLPMYASDSKNNESTYPLKIYVDKETRVQYIYNINQGGMCVLVDADGNQWNLNIREISLSYSNTSVGNAKEYRDSRTDY